MSEKTKEILEIIGDIILAIVAIAILAILERRPLYFILKRLQK